MANIGTMTTSVIEVTMVTLTATVNMNVCRPSCVCILYVCDF